MSGKSHILPRIVPITSAALLLLITAVVNGTLPSREEVKITPAAVSVETIPPVGAPDESVTEAAWRLFDQDTTTSYAPLEAVRVVVDLRAARDISRIRFYGPAACLLNVYIDDSGTWEAEPSLTGVSLDKLDQSWNNLEAADRFSAKRLLFEFMPLEGAMMGELRELEIWGLDSGEVADGTAGYTLEGLYSPETAESMLAMEAPHIIEYSASVSELSVPENVDALNPPHVDVFLEQDPSVFKRAYLKYEGYNVLRPVSVEKRINGLSWSEGFYIYPPYGETLDWKTHLEEINPQWLVRGENLLDFRAVNGTAIIRNLSLIVETDNGWNSISSVSDPSAYDGDMNTSFLVPTLDKTSSLEINFERTVEPEKLKVYLPGPINMNARLQYLNGEDWENVKAAWSINFTTMQNGWNEIPVEAPVATEALRLVFDTSSLRGASEKEAARILELQVCTSPVGTASGKPRLVVSYPRDGEYFGRTAYVKGFVVPGEDTLEETEITVETAAASSQGGADSTVKAARVSIEGKPVNRPVSDGSFSLSISKDETRFQEQADNETWTPVVTAEYQSLGKARKTLVLNKNAYANGWAGEGKLLVDISPGREKHSELVTRRGKKIKFKNMLLDIPEGAVDKDTVITIIPLTADELPELDPGMINITFPDAGYRLLPHGIKFKKAIKISFGYSKSLMLTGQKDDDANMYFYHEKARKWKGLKRVKVNPVESTVTSETDHFTDMINATLVVPEHPEALIYNPNTIKDIKAADPGAGVNLIEPPTANNMGDARLSYPIEVPPGRKGMQPNIAVQYNSSGGNGWMGLGWDMPMRAVTIDSRWGVPRYDDELETETYMLEGEMLTLVAHRDDFAPRDKTKDTKMFHSRVEGRFRKIIRHGTLPANYWWEVIDKSGTRYFYGGTPEDELDGDAVLEKNETNPDKRHIFKWMLKEVRDTNGNTIEYTYATVPDTGLQQGTVVGYQIYPTSIEYTGHVGTGDEGDYTVVFNRESGRPDVIIDARSGFKMVTADRLESIDVKFGAEVIRRYEFVYETGAFYKSLLKTIIQRNGVGESGEEFNRHEFEYYEDVLSGSTYEGFDDVTAKWNTGHDSISAGLLGFGDISAIGGSKGTNVGGSLYTGFGLLPTKIISVGGKTGNSSSNTEGLVAMADLNGDGLPDKVYKKSGALYYRANTSGPDANLSNVTFADEPVPLLIKGASNQLTDFSRERSQNTSGGFQAFYMGGSAIFDTSNALSTHSVYFEDVNGDGLVDLVDNGKVFFNHLDASGNPEFSLNSYDTLVPIGSGFVNAAGMLPDFGAMKNTLIEDNPLMDAVRVWTAPYAGYVEITGDVSLIQAFDDAREDYETADGVRVAIQHEKEELWDEVIGPLDYGVKYTPTGEKIKRLKIKRGERIFFRVQSLYDGAYDIVSWDPEITYLDVESGRNDANNLNPYHFGASDDFTYAGRTIPIKMPFSGSVNIVGKLEKTDVTSDDVAFKVFRQRRYTEGDLKGEIKSTEVLVSREMDWNKVYMDDERLMLSESVDVEKDDELLFVFEVDSNIDLTKIRWLPAEVVLNNPEQTDAPSRYYAYYTEAYAADETPEAEFPDEMPDDDESYEEIGLEESDISAINNSSEPTGAPQPGSGLDVVDRFDNYIMTLPATYDIESYPDNELVAPQAAWKAPKKGVIVMTPRVLFDFLPQYYLINKYFNLIRFNLSEDYLPDGEITFTVKREGKRLLKKIIPITNGTGPEPYTLSDLVEVEEGDELFLDYSTRDILIKGFQNKNSVTFSYSGEGNWSVPLTGTIKVAPELKWSFFDTSKPSGKILLIARQGAEILGRKVISVEKGIINSPTELSMNVDVSRDDDLFIDFVTANEDLKAKLDASGPSEKREITVIYGKDNVYSAPRTGLYTAIPQLLFSSRDDSVDGRITFEVRNSKQLLASRQISIKDGEIEDPQGSVVTFHAGSGDRLSFRFITDMPELASYIDSYGTVVASDYRGNKRAPWKAPDSGNVTIIPRLGFDFAGASPDGLVRFSVMRELEVLGSRNIVINNGEVPDLESMGIEASVETNDKLYMVFSTYDDELTSYLTEHAAWVRYADNHIEAPATFEIVTDEPSVLIVHNIPNNVHLDKPAKPSVLHVNTMPNLFQRPYRGWTYVGYKDTGECIEEEDDGSVTIECEDGETIAMDLEHFKNFNGEKSDYDGIDEDTKPKEKGTKPSEADAFAAYAFPLNERWESEDESWWVSSDAISSSRLGLDYIYVPSEEEFSVSPDNSVGGATAYSAAAGVSRLSKSNQTSFGAGYYVAISYASAPSSVYLDFKDMNGDRFPDVVGMNSIQFTNPLGAKEPTSKSVTGLSNVRSSTTQSLTLGPGGTVPDATLEQIMEAFENKPPKPDSQSPDFGFTGSLGGSLPQVEYDYMDINGDGLPDKVSDNGGDIYVKLNLGYGFAGEEKWGAGSVNKGLNVNVTMGPTLGYSDGQKGFSGGLSLGGALSRSRKTLMDINGDGLLDRVRLDGFNVSLSSLRGFISPGWGDIMVAFNTGSGFASDEVEWSGGLSRSKRRLSASQTVNLNGGASFIYPIGPLCPLTPFCYIHINPEMNGGESISREENTIRDVNGDGYPDHLYSNSDEELEVAFSNVGKTNLLAEIVRPLGAVISIDYERSGNTYEQPHSRWVMSSVTVDDKHAGDGVDVQEKEYSYEDGFYDRYERDFYGYETVTEKQYNGVDNGELSVYREIVRTYLNSNYYNKGLLESTSMKDDGGNVYRTTVNEYTLYDIAKGGELYYRYAVGEEKPSKEIPLARVFPRLDKTTKKFYEYSEGSSASKETSLEYTYDQYGNVTMFKDTGDSGSADDITADITYYPPYSAPWTSEYIADRPDTITVTGGDGVTYRYREATEYDGFGNLTKLKSRIDGNEYAFTSLDYDVYGNLEYIQGPRNQDGPVNEDGESGRHELSFTYDGDIHTHITVIEDLSYGYSSSADYDYSFGKVEESVDINGNVIHYDYDSFGRTTAIYGPYDDKGAGATATIEFTYGVINAAAPTCATTTNKAMPDDTDTLDTVLCVDGLNRVIQTKKEAEVRGAHGMVASGKAVFDGLGRVVEQAQPEFDQGQDLYGFCATCFNMNSYPTTFEYDVLDRTTEMTLPQTPPVMTDYAIEEGYFFTTVTDPEGKIKKTLKDVRERIAQVREVYNGSDITTQYEYNPMGEITLVRDAKGNETSLDYDKLGRRLSIDNPDTGLVEYVYDPAGNLIRKQTPELRAINDELHIEYDYYFNRLEGIDYPDMADVAYTYGTMDEHKAFNGLGRIIKVENGDMWEERFYGKLGETVRTVKAVRSDVPSREWPVYTTEYSFDSFGRMRTLLFPDGELLEYGYDQGGLLNHATGEKGERGGGSKNEYVYLTDILYDKFGQRVSMEYGNDVTTTYDYYEHNRRLRYLITTGAEGQTLQNITYTYDDVGNVTDTLNTGFVAKAPDVTKKVAQHFDYDDLHRLYYARGEYQMDMSEPDYNIYTNNFDYDEIGNIRRKEQLNYLYHDDPAQYLTDTKGEDVSPRPHTTYTYDYVYGGPRPHAATHIGERSYHYDRNGNMDKWEDDQTGRTMLLKWDEENRLASTEEQGKLTLYRYDDAGTRVLKRGKYGEVVYVNENYSLRNGEVASKHIFAGNTRIVTKLVMKENKTGGGKLRAPRPEHDVEGHSGRVPEKSRGNHFGWTKQDREHANQGNHYGQISNVDRGNQGQGHMPQGNANGHGNGNGNGQGQGNANGRQNQPTGSLDTDLPGKSERGLENALANGNGHKYGIYKRLDRLGYEVTVGGDIVPAGEGGGGGTGDTGGDTDTGTGENMPYEVGSYYYHGDHLGSSNVITDKKGRSYEHIEYFPYGETWVDEQRNQTNLPYRFTGKELDPETGMYYYGARYYDPRISMWVSPDPTMQHLNRYMFTRLNPVIYRDPDGLYDVKEGDNLTKIAEMFNEEYGTNVSPYDLAESHGIENPDLIFPGQVIMPSTKMANGDVWSMPSDPSDITFRIWNDWNIPQRRLVHYAKTDEYQTRNVGDVATHSDFTGPRDAIAHNIGTTGNVEYRGRRGTAHEGYQIILDANGNIVTTPENMGTFDLFSPERGYKNHFIMDVNTWIDWGNSPQDATTRQQRIDAIRSGFWGDTGYGLWYAPAGTRYQLAPERPNPELPH